MFYENIRTGTHRKHVEIKSFLNVMYDECREYLDTDFANKINNEFETRLWELILCNYLRKNNLIYLLPRNSYRAKNISMPDFCFMFNEKRYFVEAVTVGSGSSVSLRQACVTTPAVNH